VKLLVITSEPITADHLRAAVGSDATDDAEVLVIAPALHKSALRFWLSDADEAIAQAQTVQQESVDQLDDDDIIATGDTGESEPMTAIADLPHESSRAAPGWTTYPSCSRARAGSRPPSPCSACTWLRRRIHVRGRTGTSLSSVSSFAPRSATAG
jgi:hypothetical protein